MLASMVGLIVVAAVVTDDPDAVVSIRGMILVVS